MAHESGAAFFSQSASAFVEMFAGVGAGRIRKLFETARKHSPAIVFIDELDAVGTARSGTSLNREQDQTLNQLLVELDGFTKDPGVIVLAASNRLDVLDPALLRPGRFDRQVLVSVPDLTGRRAILTVHTRGKPLAPDADLDLVARRTAGLGGADLENLCNEAAMRAGRAGRGVVTAHDFDSALERVLAGLQTSRVITEKEKRVVAYHEAGHALVAHLLGDANPLHKVTIVPRGDALGYTLNLPEEDRYIRTREELIDEITMLLSGRAAEQVVFGRISTGAANDLERVTAIARSMVFEYGMGESAPRAPCAPTITRCRRRRSASATASRRGSPTTPTPTRSRSARSTATRSSGWRWRCSTGDAGTGGGQAAARRRRARPSSGSVIGVTRMQPPPPAGGPAPA